MKNNKLLIIGSVPPPVGGVTIHVDRLYRSLCNSQSIKNKVGLYSKKKPTFRLLRMLFNAQIVHIHSSNSYLRFFLIVLSKLTGNKVIITIHRDVNRTTGVRKFFDRLAISLADVPIMLNKNSLETGRKYNKNATKLSAFIQPDHIPELKNENPELFDSITKLKNKYRGIYTTNAHHLRFDKNNDEIYGIKELVGLFADIKNLCLIIADPSGEIQEYLSKQWDQLPENIFLITFPLHFLSVLQLADGFIRNTTTDGDSLSVHEALMLNKLAFATDVVDRPEGTIVYSFRDLDALKNKLIQPPKLLKTNKTYSIDDYIHLYQAYLK